MKREGGTSATKAMQEKLAADAMALDGTSRSEAPVIDSVSTKESKQPVLSADTFRSVWQLGRQALRDPFLGRISRGQYLVGGAIISIYFTVFTLLIQGIYGLFSSSLGDWYEITLGVVGGILTMALVVLVIIQLSLVAKRFHDLSHSAWMILALLIPIYNIYLAVKLVFFVGDTGLNDHGDDPLPQQPISNRWYIVIMIISVLFSFLPSLAAIYMPGIYGEHIPVSIEEMAACQQVGGEFKQVGKAQSWYCIEQYDDGGQPCESSDECQGDCLIGFDLWSVTDACARKGECEFVAEEKTAACAYNNNPFGCRGVVEVGKVICVD